MSGQTDTVLTPSQVGAYVNGMLARDRRMAKLSVQGEVSNYTVSNKGHHYFTLKDEEGSLRCVMFQGRAQFLRFQLRDGMQVIASGQASVYIPSGQYQLRCNTVQPDGIGELALAFEQLKEKLDREGLFDPAHKKPIPAIPKRIALITSPTGDAVHDMIEILGKRWPMAEVLIVPTRVQGKEAPGEIAAAIRWADQHQIADLLITGRGGGSVEELWAFNEEVVARAIYNTETPIMAAVGHEPDVTIADAVADFRARTPSNAAEEAVPDQAVVRRALLQDQKRLKGALLRILGRYRQNINRLANSRSMTDPASFFREKRLRLTHQHSKLLHSMERAASGNRERLNTLSARLSSGMERTTSRKREQMRTQAAALDAMSPLKVLARGYSVVQREDGKAVLSTKDVQTGDKLKLTLTDGSVNCRVL